ncbi:PAS domain S-box protein [Zoogloea sp. LCSB751]|uniref:PAS domain S-box protein n=1 Tax=Zoogloea sp. LCSB751 TaxID=1965277 RepID=UPI001C1F2A16|nr:PAS domain S-box protein [Zoogloea sp. LCSB751]
MPLVAVSVLIGAVGVVGYRYLSEETRRETHRTLAVIAEQKRQQIEDSLAETRIDAELYFASRSQLEMLFRRWLNSGRKDADLVEQMRSRMQEVARVRGWGGLAVVDADARPVVVVGKANVRDHAALIKDILREPRIEFVDLHRTAEGEVLYGVLAPIGASGSRPLGVAYLTWKAEQALYPLVESWPVPTRTAETYLVRRDGDNVRFLTPLRHRAAPALSLVQSLSIPTLPAGRAAKGEHGILAGGRDYREVPVLAYASPVGGTPWLMLAEIDEVEAYAGIHTLAWATGLVVGLGLLFVYSAGYLLWRRDRARQEMATLQAQQAAEARFRVIFEQAPLGVALLDSRGGRITEANPRFAEIVGLSPAEMVGRAPTAMTHPDDVAESRQHIERLNAGEISGYRLTKRYLRPDGSVVWVSLSCAPVQVANEDSRRYLAIVEDITARKEMEERLRISESRHRLLADNAVDVIVTMDLGGRFSYISPSVERLRGYSADEAIGQPLTEVLTADSLRIAEAYFARLKASLANGEAVELEHFRGELEVRRKDGASVWTDVSASPLLSADGNIVEILGVIRDVSERKRYEYKLRQASEAAEAANAAKSEFLAHMSHEIRTPMNAVLGLAQVLEREALAGHQHDMVQRIRTAGQSLLAILNDVLDLSKIEAGQLRIEQRPFDLAVLLANLDSLMGQAARGKGLALRIEGPDESPGPLLGDGLRLEQILFNLTGNAIKFTEQGEVAVGVRARAVDDLTLKLRFEIRDTGIGIDPEALGRLFAPFAQADAGIGRRFGGTGLGLSICKRLVELMGGEIGADSQPGTGSCFWFELPLQRASEAEMAALAVAAAPPEPSGPRLVGAHLLVVDDSGMNRDLVERALRLEGASSTLAADGLQAIQILQTRPERFDAVLMDVQMPVMDGLTAMRLIRGELGLIDLPVIAFTAGVRDEQQAAARAAGANDVLAKPMDLDQMALTLEYWVRSHRRLKGAVDAPAVAAAAPTGSVVDQATADAGATDAGDFPEIPGIDRERAVQRLGRDREMFIGLLELFVHDNANAVGQARSALAAGDREAAGRRMHTLGSNAGFLCAFGLMDSARALEAAIDGGEAELDAAFDALEREIADFVDASAPWR